MTRLRSTLLPLAALGLGLTALAAPAYAQPQADYEMPFPCGQTWTGTTRSNHSPSPKAVDWNRPDDIDDPVVAAAPGVVAVAESGTSGYGRWVMLDHGNGETTIYAHLSSLAVSPGQTVDQGALLGTVGESGNASGPHLHFEERQDRVDVSAWFHQIAFTYGSTLASQNCVDVPTAGNFVGGAAFEPVVFRRGSVATFQVMREGRDPRVIKFGTSTDQPVVGDWDGDGRTNVGVRTPGTRTFKMRTAAGTQSVVFGATTDLPLAGDWDGDGTWEIGVRRAGSNVFRLRAANGHLSSVHLGDADDLPVTGDWDGDGVTDLGAYDVATATFVLRKVESDGLAWYAQVRFGDPGDLPVAGDWDANGVTDLGVWDPDTATFSERHASRPTSARASVQEYVFGNPR